MSEPLVVRSDVHMDDDTFIQHMNYRHHDSLGGLRELWYVSEETTEVWRAFHYRLHQVRVGLKHKHGDP